MARSSAFAAIATGPDLKSCIGRDLEMMAIQPALVV